MASKDSKVDSNDEDSFIVLGTSPGGTLQTDIDQYFNDGVLDASQLDDALKDSATSPFKASFRLSDGPSPTSLMKASTIITDDKSVEDLQHRFGELLDETEILKVTLKKNNESMKEHMMLIATCQEDMLKTHKLHQEKFDETRVLVERLKEENKKLKDDRLSEGSKSLPDSETGEDSKSEGPKSEGPKSEEPKSVEPKSGPPSAVEFVSSPDDDTINKLSSQLALVEKQRREVIVENEKLTWQKESLEKILDATSNERDDLKDKIKNLELHLSGMETEYIMKMNGLNSQIKELQTKLEVFSSESMVSMTEITERDMRIKRLDGKVAELQNELKASKLRILELETVKLEYAKGKGEAAETAKLHKDQIQELHNRLKDAQTTVFQPMRCSLSIERDASGLYSELQNHVKLYDKTLKHLADLLNAVTHGTSESLVQTLAVVSSLHDYKLDKAAAEQLRQGLANARDQLQRQHSAALNNVAQVKGALSIFEGIFKDHKELLQKVAEKKEVTTENASAAPNIEALTAGLLARSQEIDMLKGQMVALKVDKENVELMKAQLELYKSDFEAERSARATLAGEKELADSRLRVAIKQYQDLKGEVESIRKLGTAAGGAPSPPGPRRAAPRASPNGNAAKQTTLYTCPKCMRYTSEDYSKLEDHFDFCLDDF